MKYMGGKFNLRNKILPIILQNRTNSEQLYIEPFCGGCNTLAYVKGNRIGNDINLYLIEMWKALQKGWKPKDFYTKDEYLHIKNNIDHYEPHVVGWVGFNCSFKGKFFNGYSGTIKTKTGYIRHYQTEAINAVSKQVELLNNVKFTNLHYYEISIPNNSIIYCDPPYENTTKYKIDKFDHNMFWEWCREISKYSDVYISEYNAPYDFVQIWQYEISSRLSGVNKKSVEKLFKYNI
jgi:DNA adenine methylase